MQEIRESGVNAICVFDGKERSLAKAREVSRRRETRALAMARGSLEVERLRRLRGVETLLGRLNFLDVSERNGILEALEASTKSSSGLHAPSHEQELISATVAATGSVESYTRAIDDFLHHLEAEDISADAALYSGPNVEDVWHAISSHESMPSNPLPAFRPAESHDGPLINTTRNGQPSASPEHAVRPDDTQMTDLKPDASFDLANDLSFVPSLNEPALRSMLSSESSRTTASQAQSSLPPLPTVDGDNSGTAHVTTDDLTALLVSLYQDYRNSIPKVAALIASPVASESQSDAQSDVLMTREQRQLTLDEGSFWEDLRTRQSLVSADTIVLAKTKPKIAIDTLMHKSALMHASFDRRAHPPTDITYAESKEILAALGVPCIDATGKFEAEALASAMVLGGQADYVVSEDTDVLVYGAPLLRNLSNRLGPLVLLPSSLSDLLQLPRSAYIDFAILLGTDFTQRIKNVGPARALKFIRTHGCIERVVHEETKYPPRIPISEYLQQVAVARAIFATLPPLPAREQLAQGAVDEARVNEVLHKYDLETYLREEEWDYDSGVGTNYFGDDPRATSQGY